MKRFLTAIFYWLNVFWIRLLVAAVTSRTIEGRENIPKKGPLILVCNHLNNADPPIILSALPRRSMWLVKAEWFRNPVIGTWARMGGLIPIRRYEADLAGLRKAQKALRSGLILGIYPEGTRSRNKMLAQGEPGAAILALKTGVPVLPVAIWGTEDMKLPRDILGRTKGIQVRFGKPFTLATVGKRVPRQDIEAGTETVMRAIVALLPEKYHGVYANTEGFDQTKREVVV